MLQLLSTSFSMRSSPNDECIREVNVALLNRVTRPGFKGSVVDHGVLRIHNRGAVAADGSDDFELRPSRRPGVLGYAPAVLFGVVVTFILAGITLWFTDPGLLRTFVGVVLLLVASLALIAASALWTYFRSARIYVAGGRLGRVDMWGRSKDWPISSIKGAVFGPVSLASDEDPLVPEFSVTLVLDQSGSSVMSLSPLLWADSDLERLWLGLGVKPTQGWSEPMTSSELRRLYPGAVGELPRSSLPLGESIAIITASFILAIVLSICLLR